MPGFCEHADEDASPAGDDGRLNQLLSKKSHWQVAGPTFYQLHLPYDKHFDEQVELVDSIAERIQLALIFEFLDSLSSLLMQLLPDAEP